MLQVPSDDTPFSRQPTQRTCDGGKERPEQAQQGALEQLFLALRCNV